MAEPRSFGRYRLTGTLGPGAMGEVFAAVDEALDHAAAPSVAGGILRGAHGELLP